MCKKIFNYTFQNLRISKDELLRVLSNPDDHSYEIVKEIVNEYFVKLESYSDITGGYSIINSFQTNSDMESITIHNTIFNTDYIIVKQLKNVEKIAVIACTAGSWISDLSQKYMDEGNILEGYILDQLGSVIVEKAIDMIQKSLELDMQKHHFNITMRFSPGYCGWNVAEQSKLFALLPENFCDIKLTESAFMLPGKSLSGIIGIGKNVAVDKILCKTCPKSDCLYKKESKKTKKKLTRKELFYEIST